MAIRLALISERTPSNKTDGAFVLNSPIGSDPDALDPVTVMVGTAALGMAVLSRQNCLAAPPKTGAAPIVASEYNLKAAFLLNFARFIEWPPESFSQVAAPLVIALIGEDPFGDILDRMLEAKRVNAHPLVLKRLHFGKISAVVTSCSSAVPKRTTSGDCAQSPKPQRAGGRRN